MVMTTSHPPSPSTLQDLCRYCRGDMKGDTEVATIQSIISHGLEREELRNEIYVQCIRQTTNNPSSEALERMWLLLCLCVVAFQPGKLLHKVGVTWDTQWKILYWSKK